MHAACPAEAPGAWKYRPMGVQASTAWRPWSGQFACLLVTCEFMHEYACAAANGTGSFYLDGDDLQ